MAQEFLNHFLFSIQFIECLLYAKLSLKIRQFVDDSLRTSMLMRSQELISKDNANAIFVFSTRINLHFDLLNFNSQSSSLQWSVRSFTKIPLMTYINAQ